MVNRQFSKAEPAELGNARKMPITYDEGCPETPPEMTMRFRRVNPVRNVMSQQEIIKKQAGSPKSDAACFVLGASEHSEPSPVQPGDNKNKV